jgi:hypothetical protein
MSVWVISRRRAIQLACPLYPRKLSTGAAAMGQYETLARTPNRTLVIAPKQRFGDSELRQTFGWSSHQFWRGRILELGMY